MAIPTTYDDLDPTTPVLIGVGEASERITDPGYAALPEAELAARAVLAALADTGLDEEGTERLLRGMDLAVMTRSFAGMGPGSPLGQPVNPAWAALGRVGAKPAHVVHDHLGGESPQRLVNDLAGRIAEGRIELGLILGADTTSTARHLLTRDPAARPDFSNESGESDESDGPVEDRGRGTFLVNTRHQVLHGMTNAPVQYALLENARRHRLGLDRPAYRQAMARLMAPLSRVAASHPHAAAPQLRSVADVATATPENRVVADPYLRLMIARDQVNQGAALVLASVGLARRLGVPVEQWVFLHGHVSLTELPTLERPDLSAGPASAAAVAEALAQAGVRFDELAGADLYSCFPIAITAVTDPLGLDTSDPTRLTLTGGLPYFGGAGSNYSAHAIAEAVRRARRAPGERFLVGANGGQLSKYAAGVYAASPRAWASDDGATVQARLDAAQRVPWTDAAEGGAVIETWALEHGRRGQLHGVVIARDGAGRRFLATVSAGDDALLGRLSGADGTDSPVGTPVHAGQVGLRTEVTADRATFERLHQRPVPGLTGPFEHLEVGRDGQVVEVVISRPEVGNVLGRRTHEELGRVLDAALSDPAVRAVILGGAGPDFCRGLDPTELSWGHTATTGPAGAGGLTGRAGVTTPVVAAVSGAAHDAGLELLLAAHVVVADETATFALTQPFHGLLAEHGGLTRLQEYVGPRLAHDLILTGRVLDAREALAAGLVSRVVPAGEHLAEARRVAARIVSASPVSIAASLEVAAGGDLERAVTRVAFGDDVAEGLAALREGRTPRFPGR